MSDRAENLELFAGASDHWNSNGDDYSFGASAGVDL